MIAKLERQWVSRTIAPDATERRRHRTNQAARYRHAGFLPAAITATTTSVLSVSFQPG